MSETLDRTKPAPGWDIVHLGKDHPRGHEYGHRISALDIPETWRHYDRETAPAREDERRMIVAYLRKMSAQNTILPDPHWRDELRTQAAHIERGDYRPKGGQVKPPYSRGQCRTAHAIVSRFLAGESVDSLAADYTEDRNTIQLVIAAADYCTRPQREKLRELRARREETR